jgi:hypothetical protein
MKDSESSFIRFRRSASVKILCLVFMLMAVLMWSCKPAPVSSRLDRCDLSDIDYKKDLDALYPVGDTLAAIEAIRGKPKEEHLRAAVPPGDPWLNQALMQAAAKHGAKGASVASYMPLTGTGGITSGGVYQDVLIFDAGGKLEWAYRFKLD